VYEDERKQRRVACGLSFRTNGQSNGGSDDSQKNAPETGAFFFEVISR
jgi:hypothetical protein